MPKDRRDLGLSEVAREAVIAAIMTESPALANPGPAAAAIALKRLQSHGIAGRPASVAQRLD